MNKIQQAWAQFSSTIEQAILAHLTPLVGDLEVVGVSVCTDPVSPSWEVDRDTAELVSDRSQYGIVYVYTICGTTKLSFKLDVRKAIRSNITLPPGCKTRYKWSLQDGNKKPSWPTCRSCDEEAIGGANTNECRHLRRRLLAKGIKMTPQQERTAVNYCLECALPDVFGVPYEEAKS